MLESVQKTYLEMNDNIINMPENCCVGPFSPPKLCAFSFCSVTYIQEDLMLYHSEHAGELHNITQTSIVHVVEPVHKHSTCLVSLTYILCLTDTVSNGPSSRQNQVFQKHA